MFTASLELNFKKGAEQRETKDERKNWIIAKAMIGRIKSGMTKKQDYWLGVSKPRC